MDITGLNNTEKTCQIPVDVQLQMCREAAIAFGYLCKTVCEQFGQEGINLIKENFLSGSGICNIKMPPVEENPSREVGMTLIKLLASWGISGGLSLDRTDKK